MIKNIPTVTRAYSLMSGLPYTSVPSVHQFPHPEKGETALLQAAVYGCQAACSGLMKLHLPAVYAIALRITGCPADADDVAQETFLKAFKYLPGFRGESSFKTWVLRIAGRVAIDHLRKKKSAARRLEQTAVLPEMSPDPSGNYLQDVVIHERNTQIRQAVARLSKDDNMVLRLFYFQEKSVDEIMAITGWSSTGTRSKLFRARQRLREVLDISAFQSEF
jgi:RNA polymerase sigma factor (sigma-70 family)